ncbi:uncharacterized protein LOC105196884 isoform X2 [Solenopsis invicta]|uniref:uncharacterized protein LOC105196884 isoform X2 n=1 Tax=Solenopsis invicta TaxID=13686 RepID=UPI0005963988|nr:uncharacterized protein LOC105196884 isoform X2 [Solenopsis invicta]
MLRNAFPDSQILKDVQLHRKKCTYIIKNVIAKVETENLINILKTENFSILIDESTDISTRKNLCILVQYIHSQNQQVQVQLLELLYIDATDGSSEKIYQTFKNYVEEKVET